MNCSVDPGPAVQTNFSISTLYKTTRAADNTIHWQPDIISIRKNTFYPIANLKGGIAHWTTGFTRLPMNTLVNAEWAS